MAVDGAFCPYFQQAVELIAEPATDAPLVARHPEIPTEVALQGFAGVRAFAIRPEASRVFLDEAVGFRPASESGYESRGDSRRSFYSYDPAPEKRGLGGAGTVHHVAWASTMQDHVEWRERVTEAGGRPTPVIDRFYFRSIYFREPSGVLFEIATIGPGFTVDEPLEHLGEKLSLPPNYEHLRERVEPVLTPLPNPRELVQR